MTTFVHLDQALCVRLVLVLAHFLWQGAALGTLVALGILALRRAPAQTRYGVFLCVLFVMAACPILTFFVMGNVVAPVVSPRSFDGEMPPLEQSSMDSDGLLSESAPMNMNRVVMNGNARPTTAADLPTTDAMAIAPPLMKPDRHPDWMRYAPFLVWAYLLGASMLLVRLGFAVRGGQRLRRMAARVTDAALLKTLARQTHALGVAAIPVIAYCERVAVPTVVGVLRPMILLPVSVATGLTLAQLELLLRHELVHIRRWDHLINIVQRIIEAFLFFHPAVWYVSRRVRIEREYCCDDRVLSTGVEASLYAESLVRMAELCHWHKPNAAAVAATGQPSQLRHRILRVIRGPVPQVRLLRQGMLGFVLTGMTILAAAVVQIAAVDAPAASPTPTASTPTVAAQPADAPSVPSAPAPAIIAPESQAVADGLPGEVAFEATYQHRSRGQDMSAPSMLWVKRTEKQGVMAVSYMPTMNTTYVAYTEPKKGVCRYDSYGHGRGGSPASVRILELGQGTVTVRNEESGKEGQVETLSVPENAIFQPNSRPDPYAAHMAMMFLERPSETVELNLYDWDNSGKQMGAYKTRVEYKGQEQTVVPAGTFTTHHYIETQISSGDTWYKKGPNSITEYWCLDNGVAVRILRHREPYELLLTTFTSPTPLPGIVELSKTATPVAVAKPPTGTASVSVATVHGETSAPVPGVNVYAQGSPNQAIQRSGVTDAAGKFTFDGLPAGKYMVGSGTPKGFSGGGRENVSLETDGASAQVTLRLTPGARIAGKVVDLEGKPIAGAKVRARSWGESGQRFASDESVTNAEGAYEIAGVPRGGKYRVFGEATDHYSGYISVEVSGDISGVDFKLGKSATVSGRAVDTKGRAVNDARISLEPESPQEKQGQMSVMWGGQVPLDSEGRFEFKTVAPGKYRFRLWARRADQSFEQTSVGDFLVVAAGYTFKDVKAVFSDVESERIEGTVRDETGAPVSDVNVDAITYEGVHWSAKTDAQGKYKLVALGDHTFDIYFMRDGYPDVKLAKARPGAYNADVIMSHGGTISGVVLDEISGKPVAEGGLEIVRHVAENAFQRGYRSEHQGGKLKQDGSFEMNGILPGKVYFKLSAPGYLEKQAPPVTVKAGQTTEKVEVRLTPAAIVEGSVLAGDKPLDVEQGIGVMCLDDPIHEVPAGYIIHDGKYRIDRLPAGNYEISAWARGRGHMADATKTIQAKPGQTIRVDFVLDFPAAVAKP